MKNASTPSQAVPMTDGQIYKIIENVRAALHKDRQKFLAANVQQALEHGRLDAKVTAAVEAAVEQAVAKAIKPIVYMVCELYRNRSPRQVLAATNRVPYADEADLATMPSGGDGVEENVKVEFFMLGCRVSDDELVREYEERGLTPDPYAVAAVNEADPAFADKYPNGTHWQDANGKWCSMFFGHYIGKRHVVVDHDDEGWPDSRWFGGVRKPVHQTMNDSIKRR